MKKLQRSYNESEVWLEQQMKLFWERTRLTLGTPLSFGIFLKYWSILQNACFSDDWISILFQRVSYLIRNQTLLGTEDDKIHQAKVILLTASLLRQMEASDIIELFKEEMIEPAAIKEEYPILYEGYNATQSKATMESHILLSGFDVEEKDPAIDLIVIGSDGSRDELHTFPDTTLRELIEFYKSMKNKPKSVFRVKYMGKTMFLSSSGITSLHQLKITHRSFITVVEVKPPSQSTNAPVAKKDKQVSTKNIGNKSTKKGGKKSKKKRREGNNYENKGHDHFKVEHSKRMSLVFEEVDATFKDIRTRLGSLVLKNMRPKDKDKSALRKRDSSGIKLDLPPEGVGGKAGKVLFPLLVGEVENLYVSTKKGNKQNLRTLSVDLHGCSGEDAIKMLDRKLASWVNTAHMGVHPFLIKSMGSEEQTSCQQAQEFQGLNVLY
eukprot:CAMPEP_0181111228 /NCGR_PEP_ID=MMETSP1071-20121207/19159_1 /TAXON_ID=35127 /ORGANISM="Thalassiosira sp., Strain NH16" /LENGTH=436 /DNA_ID=CAMNT_0023195099 /DNA_START=1396 /DNA_END=2707 /DNA_ORIENTATION=+